MGLLGIIKCLLGCSGGSFFFQYGYNVQNGKVYYKQAFPKPLIEMEGVDVKSFKVIRREADSMYADNGYFATDKNAVYYCGWKVEGSDGASFQLLNINFSKDKNQCYFRGTVIPDADPASFVIKEDHFSADKSHVFKREKVIDTDPSLFESYNDGYMVRTANSVSVYEIIVPIKQEQTFRYLGHSYFALDEQLYFQGDPMPSADTIGFIALDNFFSKTNKHVFYGNKIIASANPHTFRLLEPPYGRDDKHIFFFEKTIEGADVNSFEIININFQCSRDKHAAYHEDKRVNRFTQEDLVNKKLCTNCNAEAIYFAE